MPTENVPHFYIRLNPVLVLYFYACLGVWIVLFRWFFPSKIMCVFLVSVVSAKYVFFIVLFIYSSRISEAYKLWSFSIWYFLSSTAIYSVLEPHIYLRILFLNFCGLCYSCSQWPWFKLVEHTRQIVLNIKTLRILIGNLEDNIPNMVIACISIAEHALNLLTPSGFFPYHQV